ncbi:site-specific tyrosine recombinase XerD [Paenibacillus harenae]|uniref:site-specific tyrosine recombinase XerD n=1 Tax=Paenibacillus harenae TaxID=306543 RepID=UPI0027920ECE|nr:site-specific tyrosine recombinase XerD [Paenibacillus harenae]MDQ0058260.1 integrase/recombinase XerD [Paenibacillus harenae]
MKAHLNTYLEQMKDDRRLSANTLSSYERDLRAFAAYAEELGIHELAELQKHHFARYILHLKGQGRKAATITRHVGSLKAFFHYLTKEGVIIQNPSIYLEAPKQDKKTPNVLSVTTTSALLDTPQTTSPAGKRDKAMLELLYATGIRVSELVALNVEHLHMQLQAARCMDAGGKERIVPFGRMAADALNSYLEDGRRALARNNVSEPALFLNHLGTRMTRQGFWKTIKKYAKEAGITDDITPHTLRHSVAAHLLDNGADVRSVQELLGHADLSTTLKYVQQSKTRMKDVYTSAHPRA